MGRHVVRIVDSTGRPVYGATVKIYNETVGKDAATFTDGDLCNVYSDSPMTVPITQPVTSDQHGEIVFYAPQGTFIALNASRSGWSSRWYREETVLEPDPA